jgi:transcriptional regulator with XRE-family HTH domain
VDRSDTRKNLVVLRESRMWTQVRLAEEAGISPTTVSGIENGRISRPHFGTVRKLAVALEVEPEDLLPRLQRGGRPGGLSLEWSMATEDEEFDKEVEAASIEGLSTLFEVLGDERLRLRKLYGEARGDRQRRLIKAMIRQVAANSGSVEASLMAHPDQDGAPQGSG